MTVTISEPRAGTGPAVVYALGSMSLIQIGTAVSTAMFGRLGPAGTTWLRLTWAAVILLAVVRPKPWRMPVRDLAGTAMLGAVSAGMTLFFAEAVARIPLATAVSIEFLGPLTLAVLRRTNRWGMVLPPVALAGVVLVTEPWRAAPDVAGLAFAAAAGAGWAVYLVLTQKVADRVAGLGGLAMSMTAAALVSAFAGAAYALPRLSYGVIAAGAALGLLLPVLPYALEMLALRRMAVGSFGTMMSLEPAIGLIAGWVLLGQVPALWQAAGVGLVTAAAVGAARTGRRDGPAA